MILNIWPSAWWPNGAKLAGQRSVFASFPSEKTTRFLMKMMKFYEVFKNVIESIENEAGALYETGCNLYGFVILME